MTIYQSKICTNCDTAKSLDCFHNQPKQKDGKHSWCKGCQISATRKYKKNNPKYKQMAYERDIKRLYGITPERLAEIYTLQNGKCAICRTSELELTKRLHIDHNHETGNVRGLLCAKCNSGLGMFQDSIKILLNAVEYLTTFG